MAIPSASHGAVETGGIQTNLSAKSKTVQSSQPSSCIDIIDIRSNSVGVNLKDDILTLLNPTIGHKEMPTMLLYDECGLQLFEQVSNLHYFFLCGYSLTFLDHIS